MMAIAPSQKVLYPQVSADRGQFGEKSNVAKTIGGDGKHSPAEIDLLH